MVLDLTRSLRSLRSSEFCSELAALALDSLFARSKLLGSR